VTFDPDAAPPPDAAPGASGARVASEVRDARQEVFRAYVHAREQARLLAAEGAPGDADAAPRPSDPDR
jgi:hypothetical protein